MIKRLFILLVLMVTHTTYANVAVDELNALIVKKEAPTVQARVPNASVQDLSDNYYFVFIYRSTCPHCHNFAPILNDFANTFHIKISAYSLDNTPLEGFEATPFTPELFQTFYVGGGFKPTVPALFLVNRHTLDAYAVLFGDASSFQLARRVDELKQHIEEKFHD